MTCRSLSLAVLFALIAGVAFGQTAKGKWTPPRTPESQPDLQGIWTIGTVTPLQRPSELAAKEFFTEAEAAAFEKQAVAANDSDRRGATGESDLRSAYNNLWYDWGSKVVKTRRTSMIIDPRDGKIPALTPLGEQIMRARAEARRSLPAGPEDIGLAERCMLFPTGELPMLPYAYNNNYQFLQTRDQVVISTEMAHDVRMIPVNGRPHLEAGIRQWRGDSRGHWEGDTLVVDTTNFNGKARFGFLYDGATDENLHLTERFTRTDPDTILYQFTVNDPTIYTKPFTGELTMAKTPGPIYEYACHEGNYAMANMLSGARAEEKKAAGKPTSR